MRASKRRNGVEPCVLEAATETVLAIGITLTIQNNFRRQRVISTLTASADTAPVVGSVQSAARPRR